VTTIEPPSLRDVLAARRRIAPHLPQTPAYRYPVLGERLGCEAWVKHENHLPGGAFKVRGGVNLVACFSEDERAAGVAGASTGNHGTSVAFAAQRFGVRAVICVPESANPVKVARMRDLGAEIVFHGDSFDDARRYCERLAAERGLRYIHSGDEPLLIAGVATSTLELIEAVPDVDVIVVPVGGGSGAAGACIVAAAANPGLEVIGVQSEAAPAAYNAWRTGDAVEVKSQTFAEGLATSTAFSLPQRILREGLADFLLVSDDDIRAAMVLLIDATQNLGEAAGAAALAAVMRHPDRFAGRRVAMVCSGGNVSLEQLRAVLAT
jgi:threonine dehydratase